MTWLTPSSVTPSDNPDSQKKYGLLPSSLYVGMASFAQASSEKDPWPLPCFLKYSGDETATAIEIGGCFVYAYTKR